MQNLSLITFFLCTQLVVPWIDPLVADLNAYVSPANFYEQGELSVDPDNNSGYNCPC